VAIRRGIQVQVEEVEDEEAAAMVAADWLADHVGCEIAMATAMSKAKALDPTSLEEVQGRSDWDKWKEAMDAELETLEMNETWEAVLRPQNTNVVGIKWVFKLKKNSEGKIV
jgi:hypothetical protein